MKNARSSLRLRSIARVWSGVASIAGALALGACGEPANRYPDTGWIVADGGPDAPWVDAEPGAPVLQIDYLDPDHGPFAGGTEVVLRGRGFVEGMEILVGGRAVEVLDLQVIDDRRATIRTPAGDPGPADVTVNAGELTATAPGAFTYEAITVDPPSGSVAGGTWVTISGFGTSFQDGDVVRFDGDALTGVEVLNEQTITGFTPPGVPGSADVEVTGASGTVRADDAYSYTNTSDSFLGGLGGGPITGSLNITVVNALTEDGVDHAFVAVGDPATSSFTGYTDPFGQITFSGPTLLPPVSVTAAADGYESSAFVVFDATDVTIFLVPIPDPMPGTFPPGRAMGYVEGYIVFGDATGIGTTGWSMVPEPRSPSEFKRAYVYTTYRDAFSGNPDPGPGSIINYADDGATSWRYSINARPSALAVYAVAGLYDPLADPDGPGPIPAGVFTPFVLGVHRGVLVGPGEIVSDVDVVMDIPLDTALQVELVDPPPLNTPGYWGPTEYRTQAFVDLGGEGVLVLPGNTAVFPAGATAGLLENQAPLVSSIADGSYTVFAGAYALGGGNPFSVRVLRGITDLGVPVVADGFLGTPRPVDPISGGVAAWDHVAFAPEGGTGVSTFNLHILTAPDGTPLWRIFTEGNEFDVPLPDVSAMTGGDPLPSASDVYWTCYEIQIPGLTFDDFNYGHLNANYWSAYAADAWAVRFP